MRKQLFAAITAVLLPLPLYAADSYTIDSRHTFPSFEVSHLGFSTQRGRFNKTTGTVLVDQAAGTGSVEIVIDAASVDTGLEKLEQVLKSDEFFDVAKYPTITFRSDKIRFEGGKPVAIDGQLTMHGVTQPVILTVTGSKFAPNPISKKDSWGVDATATVKRSDFGITKLVPAVGDEVKILIQIEAYKG